jgi:hypothetical protein
MLKPAVGGSKQGSLPLSPSSQRVVPQDVEPGKKDDPAPKAARPSLFGRRSKRGVSTTIVDEPAVQANVPSNDDPPLELDAITMHDRGIFSFFLNTLYFRGTVLRSLFPQLVLSLVWSVTLVVLHVETTWFHGAQPILFTTFGESRVAFAAL